MCTEMCPGGGPLDPHRNSVQNAGGFASGARTATPLVVGIPHAYIGHAYIGHAYIGHAYIRHAYIGHAYIGHAYIGHAYIGLWLI